MPYTTIKKGKKYQLKNTKTKKVVSTKFKTRSSAMKAGKRYHSYSKK
tara:strand:- start:527 stop:667 length:141 start_codon:yes stop_codon:yes gene_type:complete